MIGSALMSAWQAVWYPSVILPSALATLGAHLAFEALGAGQGFWVLPPATMGLLAAVVCVQFWVGLCVTATAVQILRSGGRLRLTYWVSATVTFQAGLISMAVTVAILAGLLAFVVPGVFLALRWSQAMLLILDGRAEWFESAEDSALLTYGHRMEILGIWMIVGVGLAAANWLTLVLGDVSLAMGAPLFMPAVLEAALRIAANAVGLVIVAATYHELTPDWSLWQYRGPPTKS